MRETLPRPAEQELLRLAREVAREMRPGLERAPKRIDMGSSLERDLGLDSLGRAARSARLERVFAVRLPEEVLGSAETPADLAPGADVWRPAAAGAAGGVRPRSCRRRARAGGGADAAQRPRLLRGVLWRAAGRRRAGAALPAGAAPPDRGSPAAAGRHPHHPAGGCFDHFS